MSHPPIRTALTAAAVIAMAVMTTGQAQQERDRTKIADNYKWNLAHIYPDDAAWRTHKESSAAEIPTLREFQGKLGSSPATLAAAMEAMTRLDKELSRLYVYASMLADQDTRVSETQGMQQEMQQIYARFGAEASYIEPEILKVGTATIEKFIAGEKRLAPFAFYLRDISRRAAHTLSDAEEKILADAAPPAGAACKAHHHLANADFPYPTIKTRDGRTVKVEEEGCV